MSSFSKLFAVSLLVAPVLLGSSQNGTSNVCYRQGRQCDKNAPCCNDKGFCVTDPYQCLVAAGCNQSASANGTGCTPIPMCSSYREDFTNSKMVIPKTAYKDPNSARFWIENPDSDNVEVKDGNLILTMKYSTSDNRGHGATIASIRQMQYGNISARIKTASGRGFVSSFITKTVLSDNEGDEIDFEQLGGNPNEIQTNYYTDGQIDYTKGIKHNIQGITPFTEDYHIYTINWMPDQINWIVDGQIIRTLLKNSSDKFPQANQRIWFGLWDAGCNQAPGTMDWAGHTPWCNDTSLRSTTAQMMVDWIEVKCMTEDPTAQKVSSSSTPSATQQPIGAFITTLFFGLLILTTLLV